MSLAPDITNFELPQPRTSLEVNWVDSLPRADVFSFDEFYLDAPIPRPGIKLHVYHGTHARNIIANALEVEQMVALGDNEEFSKEEFVPYFDASFIIELCRKDESGQTPLGVARITPYSPEFGLKTLSDLSVLSGESRQATEDKFMIQSGCVDMAKTWDITTLALQNNLSMTDKSYVINNLLVGLNITSFRHMFQGRLTHIISANDPAMYLSLVRMGYPMRDIGNYGAISYDVGGVGESMTCRPTYFEMNELHSKIGQQATRHLKLIGSMKRVFNT